MTDENPHDGIPPFFVRTQFPFVFVPASTNVNFTETSTVEDQTTTESSKPKEKQETTDDEELNTKENERLRISQPEYSDLLKKLDFRFKRMVDVTDLLPDHPLQTEQNPSKDQQSNKDDSSSTSDSDSDSDDQEREKTDEATSTTHPHLPFDKNVTKELENQLKKSTVDEDDDTSKQATQNYDLHDNEKNNDHQTSKPNPSSRLTTEQSSSTQDENLSSIPRLNPTNQNGDHPMTWEHLMHGKNEEYLPSGTILIISQGAEESETTPRKSDGIGKKSSPNGYHRPSSSSSESDALVEPILQRSKVQTFPVYHDEQRSEVSVDEDLHDLNNHLTQYLLEEEHQRKKSAEAPTHRKRPEKENPRSTTDTWLAMLEKLEREHKQRLEQQQKQYEAYMQELEEKMKRRLDEYLSSANNSMQESKSETMTEQSSGLPSYRPRTFSNGYVHRGREHDYPSSDHPRLSRSQSREEMGNVRLELSAKHSKHISDLKLYYEHEIEELTNQLNRSRMGTTASATRQSIETIERINNENIRLHDEVKDLRHSLKTVEEENHLLNRRLDELRSHLTNKDVELKNLHRTIAELEQQITEARHIKERQDERFRHADRQSLMYREENEKLKKDLNLTRERLTRLEERHREQEAELKTLRQTSEHSTQRTSDETKLNSTMSMNLPTSREYGRFVMTTSRYSSSTITSPRDATTDNTTRYSTTTNNNSSDSFYPSERSPRNLTRVSDYINDKGTYSHSYVPPPPSSSSSTAAAPPRTHYSPRKSPTRHPVDQIPDLIENQLRHADRLEERFDELLRKKRDLEARMNRIPTRGLTLTDRHLLETLEREIERVEQQISSVKLELRKMNILRTH